MDIHYLKLKGKVNIGESLELEHDYQITIRGSITGLSKDTNHNGDMDIGYRFEPLTVEVLTPKGETIRADRYKQSQKMRLALKKKWESSHEELDFPDFYKRETDRIIREINGEEIN